MASAWARSEPSISMSNTLPWRTLATPATPSERSAPSIALPCGSRIPVFRVTVTRAFIAVIYRMNRQLGREKPSYPRLNYEQMRLQQGFFALIPAPACAGQAPAGILGGHQGLAV